MDFLDALKAVDDAVDLHLSEGSTLTVDGVEYQLRGPLDRDIYTDETASAHVGTLQSTQSVQQSTIPVDPRGGFLVCRGERFRVVDMDAPKDGRTVLILRKLSNVEDDQDYYCGLPYTLPFTVECDGSEDGLPNALPYALRS